MKRVSFEVARVLKDAGYPQGGTDQCFDSKGVLHYTTSSDSWLNTDIYIDAPTYMEAWLWLWREKGTPIHIDYAFCRIDPNINDPEEAIIVAINHLADSNLIK